MAQTVQPAIGRLKIRRNPSSVLTRSRHFRAGGDNVGKTSIDGNAVTFVPQRFRQRTTDMQLFRQQYGARVGGKPLIQPVFGKPRENTLAVGRQKPPHVQISAYADQPVIFRRQTGGIGKRIIMRRQIRNFHKSHSKNGNCKGKPSPVLYFCCGKLTKIKK